MASATAAGMEWEEQDEQKILIGFLAWVSTTNSQLLSQPKKW
jgi:hypothetical protein